MSSNKRRKNLVRPRLQLKIALAFLMTSGALVVLMALLVSWRMTAAASDLPSDAALMFERITPALIQAFLLTFAVLVPLTFSIGVLISFPVVGPVYRFERFLQAVVRGERPGPCTIRQGDELHDFCELLNEATRPMREAPREEDEAEPAEAAPREAARAA